MLDLLGDLPNMEKIQIFPRVLQLQVVVSRLYTYILFE